MGASVIDSVMTKYTHVHFDVNSALRLFLLLYGFKVTHGLLFTTLPTNVCYGSLGCFSDSSPYTNTPGLLPHSPEVVGTRFTRDRYYSGDVVNIRQWKFPPTNVYDIARIERIRWLFTSLPTKVCYGSLGCFSGSAPYTNTPGLLPHSPEVVGTRFLLYTRNSTHRVQELVINDKKHKCSWRTFCKHRDTKIIIHGYFDHGNMPWIKEMAGALLKREENYNIIVVDWKPGARDINYLQAAANIRLVGAQVAQLIDVLVRVYGIRTESIHIIGHSLGAHAAGYAGEYIDGIGRITGLDPAGPSFEGQDPAVRLDDTDAIFVDVIHTDGEHLLSLGFGMMTPIGHVDFYPNGGKDQPGCPTTYFAQMGLLMSGDFSIIKNFGCSHLRVLDLYTESINSKCSFTSYPCQNVNQLDNCMSCGTKGCLPMGFELDWTTKRGVYSLSTNGDSPYCIKETGNS